MSERQICRTCFCLGYALVPVNGEWSCLEHLSGHETGAEIVRLSEQLAELTDRITKTESSLDQYMQMFDHALDCVNEVFQECSDNPNPILKDYAKLGADKFEEVKRLACDYKMALERLAEAEAERDRERNRALGLLDLVERCENNERDVRHDLAECRRLLREFTKPARRWSQTEWLVVIADKDFEAAKAAGGGE